MSGQLSARLARIRASSTTSAKDSTQGHASVKGIEHPDVSSTPPTLSGSPDSSVLPGSLGTSLEAAGWQPIAPYVAFRKLVIAPPSSLPAFFSSHLVILCPGSSRVFLPGHDVDPRRLLFFDLETSGLSGGAGTVAFLAAFGRFTPSHLDGKSIEQALGFEISQYLLCDYPGEANFLAYVNVEFQKNDPVLVSYNGKAFDMQIIRTRFAMNGLVAPDPPHWDLLHAVRRLWRRTLPSCSQQAVEQNILGICRSDDLPGSQAPDAWFDYLRSHNDTLLAAVGEHNALDIAGIAHVSVELDRIARAPLTASRVPAGALAHAWWLHTKKTDSADALTDALLEKALCEGDARASLILASRLYRRGLYERASDIRRALALGTSGEHRGQVVQVSVAIRINACRQLARDAERRLVSYAEALRWIDLALEVENLNERDRNQLAARRERLLFKVKRG